MSAVDARMGGNTGAGLTWSLGLATSLATHAGAAALLAIMLQPEPVPDQPQPKSKLQIETQVVAQSQATEQAPQQTAAASASAKGAPVSEGIVPQSRAQPAALPQDKLAATAPPEPTARPAAPVAVKLAEAAAPPVIKPEAATSVALPPVPVSAAPVTAMPAPAQSIAAVQTAGVTLEPADDAAPPVKAVAASSTIATAQDPAALAAPLRATADTTPALQPLSQTAAVLQPLSQTAAVLPAATPPGARVTETPPEAQPAPEAAPDAQPVAAAPAGGEHMVAALAWSGGADSQIDPQSLKAIASFMRPGDAAAQSDDVHDALASVLASVPCSRLQAEFNPATGSLELRGHVPDESLRAPILKALQAQLGDGIKVADAMLILPRPQCGALAGIADVGLPQSTDQNTNPKLIGADAQARAYSYRTGQTMVLDLAAPDYDAYIYVDYFDANGQVIHLVPNATVPLRLRPAKTAMRVGAPDAGEPFLGITIGPPYGQEIAAAFAASAPLYDGFRPLSEPAAPYLDWLKVRVSEARAKDPDFKGEWVYFFVSTSK